MKSKSFIFLACFVSAVFSAGGLSPWQAKPKAPAKAAPPQPQLTQGTISLGPKEKSTFPNPWPAPLPRPEGRIDDVAEILASKVLAGGPDALPALERAALECGFAIHGEDGRELYKPDEKLAVGVSILDFDLFVAAELTKRKQKTKIADLQRLSVKYPALKDVSLAKLFATTATEYGDEGEESANKRFWGQFVQALGTESGGEFGTGCSESENAELCGAQVTWLLYMAAAQATVVMSGSSVQPAPDAQEPPAEDPPTAEDPPPHGPKLVRQSPQIDVITNLNQALQLSASPGFQQALQQWTNQGVPPNLAMLEMCRLRTIELGVRILYSPVPKLVRTKVYGQKGGNSKFSVGPELQIDSELRRRYQKAVAVFPQAKPLPPDGQIKNARITITPPDECDLDPTSHMTTSGMEIFTLIGKTQTQHLSAQPLAVDLDREVGVLMETSFGTKSWALPMEIRDWLSTGLSLRISASVKGSGNLKYPGGQKRSWSINRHLSGYIKLTQFLPAAFVHAGSTDAARYNSWMQFPSNSDYSPEMWQYWLQDEYKSTNLVGGCGVKTGNTTTTTQLDEDRPADASEKDGLKFSTAFGELDRKANAVAIQTTLPKIPIFSHPGGKGAKSLLEDIILPPTTPHEFVKHFKILDMSTRGPATSEWTFTAVFPYTGTYDTSGDGNKKVGLTFEVELFHMPGSTFSPTQFAADWKQAKAVNSELITSLIKDSNSRHSADVNESLPGGHGPLWVSDASAATCSEVEIADTIPPRQIATK